MVEKEIQNPSQKQQEKDQESKLENKPPPPPTDEEKKIDWEKKWEDEMEARSQVEKELEELRDFKREIEKRDRQNLIDNIKKHLPDFEVKDTDDDTFLRGVLLGYEKMLQIQKKNEKRQKPKKIPSETGESPEEIPLWRQILD